MTHHAVEFVSQRDRACANAGCGVASARMLLQYANVRPLPNYRQLIRALRLHAAGPHGEPAPAVYPRDVEDFFRRRRLPANVVRNGTRDALHQVLKWLKRGPVMVLVNGPDWDHEDHWIVLVGEEVGMLVYLDPWYRPTQRYCRRVTSGRLADMWRGAAVSLARPRTRHTSRSRLTAPGKQPRSR